MATTDAPSTPQLDQVTLPGAGAYAGKSLGLSVSCELMKNQLPGADIDATKDTAVVQDATGRPMVFTIGSDAHLRLLTMQTPTATGFTATDLLAGFDGYSGATTFDVSQDLSGRITLAAALTRADGSGTDVVIAPTLSDDLAQTDWAQFYKLAPKVAGIDPTFVAGAIQIGSSDGGNAPFTIVIGAIGGQDMYYRIDTPSSPAKRLEFPENVPVGAPGVHMSIGFAFGDRATWFLYSAGQSVTLEATTLPSDGGTSLTYDYSPGYTPAHGQPIPRTLQYNCLATPTGARADAFSISSDVYVGSNTGVYLFPGAQAGGLVTVTDALQDVHQLYVTQDAANISVWALCSPNQLYYIYGKKGSTYTWNSPILFNPSAIHIAPLRNRALQANELFVVNQDESVTHHWQDPGTTLWQQRTLSVPKSTYVLDATTFTTTLRLEDDAGNPLRGLDVDITASEWFYATANGLVYSIDIDRPAAIATDGMGTITLIAMAPDISPPIFHVSSASFDKIVNIYPNGGIHKGLAAIQSGDDLKHATAADGTPVIDPSTSQSTLDGVAANVSTMTTTAAGQAPGLDSGGTTFVVVEDVKHSGQLASMARPGGAIAMTVHDGVWQPHPQPHALMSSFGVFDDILSWPGDALHWLENAFDDAIDYVGQGITFLKDGASFVLHQVEDGLELALSFGSKLLKLALKTIGAVFKALNWLLKLVGIDLQKILAWLGHLFGWDDIWDTHKVIASVMRSGVDYAVAAGASEIEQIRRLVAGAFADAKQELAKLVLGSDADVRPKAQDLDQRHSPASQAGRSSPGNFGHYQIQHSGMLQGAGTMAAGLPAGLEDFLSDVVLPSVQTLVDDLEKDLQDIANLCSEPDKTVEDAKQLAVDLADTVLDPVSTIVDGMFTFVEDLLGLLKSALEDEIEIPFLTEFYEFITDLLGDEEDFTVINGLALLISIPLVEMWKAGGGGAPFADGAHGLDSPDLFAQLAAGTKAPAPTPQLRSRALAAADAPAGADSPAADAAPSQLDQDYSRYGGGIAALAGLAGALVEGLTWAAGTDGEGESGTLSTADKIGIGLGATKFACTFPVPIRSSEPPWVLRVVNWALSGLEVLITPFLRNGQVKGGVNGVIDSVIFVLSLVADGLDSPNPLGWGVDIISNVSGPVRGFGAAAKEPYSLSIGMGAGMIGGFLGVVYVLVGSESDGIYSLINVGG